MTATTFATRPVTATSPLSAQELVDLVTELAEYPRSWEPYVRFNPDQRWWTQLRSDDMVDVWLLTWVADTGTDLHDHGASAGAFTVVSGRLEEVRPTGPNGQLVTTTLLPGEARAIERGVVHDVRSPSSEPTISIHAYSPPLSEMTFYEAGFFGPRATRTVATKTAGALV